mgnify:CR=1 FL=1
MKAILVLILAVVTAVFSVSAQEIEKVYLKDGRCFDGYISKQIPGETVYVTTSQGIAILPWNDICKTEKLQQDESCMGIKELVVLSCGDTLTGRIVEQVLGQSLLLKLDGGPYMGISISDILSIQSEPISDSVSIWEQIPLLDSLVLKDGTAVDGVILSRKMGESVTVLLRDSTETVVCDLSEIAAYYKIQNGGQEPGMSLVRDVSVSRDTSGAARVTLDVVTPSEEVMLISEEGQDIVIELQETR